MSLVWQSHLANQPEQESDVSFLEFALQLHAQGFYPLHLLQAQGQDLRSGKGHRGWSWRGGRCWGRNGRWRRSGCWCRRWGRRGCEGSGGHWSKRGRRCGSGFSPGTCHPNRGKQGKQSQKAPPSRCRVRPLKRSPPFNPLKLEMGATPDQRQGALDRILCQSALL